MLNAPLLEYIKKKPLSISRQGLSFSIIFQSPYVGIMVAATTTTTTVVVTTILRNFLNAIFFVFIIFVLKRKALVFAGAFLKLIVLCPNSNVARC
jgi:hypothetical protein